MNSLPKKEILGVGITDASSDEILEYIFSSFQNNKESYYIVTPNPEMIMLAQHDFSFKSVLNRAELALCDGVGLWLAARVLNRPIKERLTGTDLMEELCKNSVRMSKESVRKPVNIGFLGAGQGIALKAAECLREKYPGLNIVYIAEEWGTEGFTIHDSRFKKQDGINMNHIDILFVAFGFPKQEKWMAEHVGKIPVSVMMGVGGAFDYFSGTVSRAPRIVRRMGLEWLYRLVRQPWRIRRQLALLHFISLVIGERLRK